MMQKSAQVSLPDLNIWLYRVGRGSWLGSPHRWKFKQRPQGNHFTSVTYLRFTSQMIADRKKQGTSCHWMPSLYLLIKKLNRQIFDKFFLPVIEDGQAGLVVILLESLNSQTTPVFYIVEPGKRTDSYLGGLSDVWWETCAPSLGWGGDDCFACQPFLLFSL